MALFERNDLIRLCPRLFRHTPATTETSERTSAYNCLAFALGDELNWWTPDPEEEPAPLSNNFWPTHAPQSRSVEAILSVCESRGFERCGNGDFEPGYEKIVALGSDGLVRHMAVQRPQYKGRWRSKFGEWEDGEHELDAILGGNYGEILLFARRAVPTA